MSKTNSRVRISDLRNVLESEFVADYNPFQLYFDQMQLIRFRCNNAAAEFPGRRCSAGSGRSAEENA